MKAPTWRLHVGIAMLTCAVCATAGAQNPPAGLPAGLPTLPGFGEMMQRQPASGLALSGFDPVAYRLDGRARPGRGDIELVHGGVAWRFASAANREAFREAAAIYEPAFAGYDATAIAEGAATDSDPRLFSIVGGRLVLFRTSANRERYLADAGLRLEAERRWPEVSDSLAR